VERRRGTSQYNPESDFKVTKKGNAVEITQYVGKATVVNIPPTIQGGTVTTIDWEAFQESNITSVTIPNSVTTIDGAFAGCRSLVSVTLPSELKSIGAAAFARCMSLTSITIPSKVTSIGREAFKGCGGLTSITIPASVTSIDEYAFINCSLTSVTFQGTIPSSGFHRSAFFDTGAGDLRNKFYATDAAKGTPGTYTRPDTVSKTWTKK